MNDFIIYFVSVSAIIGFVILQWRRSHSKKCADVYTDNDKEADYGKGFGPVDDGLNDKIRDRIFKRDNDTCQITKRRGIRGQPGNGFEYLSVGLNELTGIAGRPELEVGHYPIPHALGGPTTDDNLILMIKGLNRKLSDAVTPAMEDYCRKHGKKIWCEGVKKMSVSHALESLRQKRKRESKKIFIG